MQCREMFLGKAWERGKLGAAGWRGCLGAAVAGVFAGGTGLVGLRGGWRRRGDGMLRGIGRLAGHLGLFGDAVKGAWLAVGRGSRPWATAAGAAGVCVWLAFGEDGGAGTNDLQNCARNA